MKIHDLLKTNRENSLDEALFNIGQPMGALSTAGSKIMAKMGSQTAQGKLQTGNVANQLSNALKQYMGRTGQKQITADVLLGFLSQNGYPTQSAQKIIQDYTSKTSTAVPQGNAPHPADNNPNINLGQNESQMEQTNQAATLPPDIVNKALMAAVQDSAKAGGVTGAATKPMGSRPASAAGSGNIELNQLKGTLQAMDQRLRRAGI